MRPLAPSEESTGLGAVPQEVVAGHQTRRRRRQHSVLGREVRQRRADLDRALDEAACRLLGYEHFAAAHGQRRGRRVGVVAQDHPGRERTHEGVGLTGEVGGSSVLVGDARGVAQARHRDLIVGAEDRDVAQAGVDQKFGVEHVANGAHDVVGPINRTRVVIPGVVRRENLMGIGWVVEPYHPRFVIAGDERVELGPQRAHGRAAPGLGQPVGVDEHERVDRLSGGGERRRRRDAVGNAKRFANAVASRGHDAAGSSKSRARKL